LGVGRSTYVGLRAGATRLLEVNHTLPAPADRPSPDFPFFPPPFRLFPCREQTRRSALRAAGRGGRSRGPTPPRRTRTGGFRRPGGLPPVRRRSVT
ncbi:hypothetical protein, partial [Streptomyces mirabilis]